ncbi:MAG: Fe-S cluster assembly protein SufD, partial [Gammaproteobacteria bacterium]|nr:Fe-S cluster assembly protein SufD [Gammaproteobacteria bacterium]
EGPRLVFVNGQLIPPACHLDGLPAGLAIESLAQVLRENDTADTLDRVVDLDRYRLARLNTALLQAGAPLRAARGVAGDAPIYLLFLTLGDAEALQLVQPRVLIEAAEAASVTVIEHHCGEGEAAVINAVTEIVAQPGSRVTHYRIQEHADSHAQVAGLNARLDRDAALVCHNIDLGGALVRNDVHVRLIAPGADVELNGLYFTRGTSHVDNHTRIDHLAPRTTSREDYRGVLDGRSRAVFNGKVLVAEDAQKIEAHQSNNNLLLSRECEVDTKPELEIYADDVKCSHGATVGQLDATALFYLRSRGLDEDTARGLLTFAFAEEVIARLGIAPLAERLSGTVIGHLPDSDRLREFT